MPAKLSVIIDPLRARHVKHSHAGVSVLNYANGSHVILIARIASWTLTTPPVETLMAMKEKMLSLVRGIAPRSWQILG